MQNIKLDTRLSAVAFLVRKGSRIIDVGTDHAYLPCFLLQNDICSYAIACDINSGPLENARETINETGLSDKIETILSNGLDKVSVKSGDDVVIAGMGGILIADIVSRCKRTKDETVRIIAQPMTHSEEVRKYFIENGFEILREKAAVDGSRKYCVILAAYTGIKREFSCGYIYYGELAKNKDAESKEYLLMQLSRLKKRFDALTKSGKKTAECEYLEKVIADFESVLNR